MKKFHQYMMILAASALTACSSLEISDAEAYGEEYPAGFDAKAYMDLHPVLYTLQVRDYVLNYNKALKASTDEGAYDAEAASDKAVFEANEALKQNLLSSPYYAGLGEKNLSGNFNLIGVADDWAALEDYRLYHVDLQAIGLQYIMYGRAHGWAYRVCAPTEVGGATTELLQYPVQVLVCRDAATGIDHIIP